MFRYYSTSKRSKQSRREWLKPLGTQKNAMKCFEALTFLPDWINESKVVASVVLHMILKSESTTCFVEIIVFVVNFSNPIHLLMVVKFRCVQFSIRCFNCIWAIKIPSIRTTFSNRVNTQVFNGQLKNFPDFFIDIPLWEIYKKCYQGRWFMAAKSKVKQAEEVDANHNTINIVWNKMRYYHRMIIFLHPD